jgi:hypothetical protein
VTLRIKKPAALSHYKYKTKAETREEPDGIYSDQALWQERGI